jgi:NTP pyrophosphatase (non-canonical NTP hydrolase)
MNCCICGLVIPKDEATCGRDECEAAYDDIVRESNARTNHHQPEGEPMLTFEDLRAANLRRLPEFKNRHGQLAHSEPDGSDWTPAQWLQAVIGELGEYANKRKKFERGDLTEAEFLTEAASELADVQIYLDILAFQLRIDLGEATRTKFNEVSERVGCPQIRL